MGKFSKIFSETTRVEIKLDINYTLSTDSELQLPTQLPTYPPHPASR